MDDFLNVKVKKEYLAVVFSFKGKELSILEAAEILYMWLKVLSKYEVDFNTPTFQARKKVILNFDEIGKTEAIDVIAETILRTNRYEIQFYEGEKNPDLNYVYKYRGYILSINYENICQSTVGVGSNRTNSLTLIVFKKPLTYIWFYNLLRHFTDTINPYYTYICITSAIDDYLKFKLEIPLTWITYFSHDFEHKIPDDLEGVEYIYTDKGKYLITSREDFLKDKESFFAHRDKIMRIGKELAERVPGLVRKF